MWLYMLVSFYGSQYLQPWSTNNSRHHRQPEAAASVEDSIKAGFPPGWASQSFSRFVLKEDGPRSSQQNHLGCIPQSCVSKKLQHRSKWVAVVGIFVHRPDVTKSGPTHSRSSPVFIYMQLPTKLCWICVMWHVGSLLEFFAMCVCGGGPLRSQTWSCLRWCHYGTPVFLWPLILRRGLWLSIVVVSCPWTSKTLIYINIFFTKCPSLRHCITGLENPSVQFLCEVIVCLLRLHEEQSFPVVELCWSHPAVVTSRGWATFTERKKGPQPWIFRGKNQRNFNGKNLFWGGKFLNTAFKMSHQFSLDLFSS